MSSLSPGPFCFPCSELLEVTQSAVFQTFNHAAALLLSGNQAEKTRRIKYGGLEPVDRWMPKTELAATRFQQEMKRPELKKKGEIVPVSTSLPDVLYGKQLRRRPEELLCAFR